jgi:hypothetical protein
LDDHQRCREFALAFAAKAKKRCLRVETDLRRKKINYRVQEHSLARIAAGFAGGWIKEGQPASEP